MKKRRRQRPAKDRDRTKAPVNPAPRKHTMARASLAFAAVASVIAIGLLTRSSREKAASSQASVRPHPGPPTFTRDIAPIIFENCGTCHRPEQSAPFSLLTYAEVKKKAKLIAEVTRKRYMPPWLPEHGYGHFVNERWLSEDEISIIQQWVAEGAVEGDAADLPPMPEWPGTWALGKPDLVVTLPSPYTLPAAGIDVYRNFVVPIPTTKRRYVRAVEFHPGNNKVVHHSFIETDPTRQARHFVDHGNPPGFDGMQLPQSVQMPSGQMLGWQPGKPPLVSPPGLAWVLEPDSDLVLQLHMHPSGKPENVTPSVGLYFTDQPPTNTPFRLNLIRFNIDIPAGDKDYAIENRYVLPVDATVLRILPHTHYLGKELQGYAIMPDGTKKWLLLIKNWDFNWQADYRYAEPIFLPRGTTLVMHFTYDNSADNVHNPSQPPKRVKFGLQTTDEMGELWFQLLLRSEADREILARDFFIKFTKDAVEENTQMLVRDPNDAAAHTRLAVALVMLGRTPEALGHLTTAVRLQPDDDQAHSALAGIYIRQHRLDEARTEYEAVLRLKPDDYQAYGGLGSVFLMQGNLARAESCYENALRLNPDDPIARANLERTRKAQEAARSQN